MGVTVDPKRANGVGPALGVEEADNGHGQGEPIPAPPVEDVYVEAGRLQPPLMGGDLSPDPARSSAARSTPGRKEVAVPTGEAPVLTPAVVDDDAWAGTAALETGALTLASLEPEKGAWAALKRGVLTAAGFAFYEGLGLVRSGLKWVGLRKPAKVIAGVQEAWRFPLSSTVYPMSDQYNLAWHYLLAKLTVLGRLAPELWKRLMGTYPIPSLEEKPLPPEAQIREPIDRQTVSRVLGRFVEAHQGEDRLPDPLRTRLIQAYESDEAVLAAWGVYARDYLGFVVEDTDRFLAVYNQDQPLASEEVDRLFNAALEAYRQVQWRGEPVDGFLFAGVRDLRDARQLLEGTASQGPMEASAQGAFQNLEAAERRLGELIERSPGTGQPFEAYQLERFRAREEVRRAYEVYASQAGLGTSHETFSYLPEQGMGLRPVVLKAALDSYKGWRGDGLVPLVLGNHQTLHQAADALKRAAKNAKTEVRRVFEQRLLLFQIVMRRFLAQPGNARRLQYELVSLNAAREALLKYPRKAESKEGGVRDLFSLVVTMVYTDPDADTADVIRNYRLANQEWLTMVGRAKKLPHDKKAQIDALKAEEALNRAELALLDSAEGIPLLQRTVCILESAGTGRGMTGLTEALQAHAAYWRARRAWSTAEQARREQILPAKIDYLAWREGEIGRLAEREIQLIYEGARALWQKALAGGKKIPRALRDQYEQALKVFEGTGETPGVIEGLRIQTERRKAHWRRLRDPTIVLAEGDKENHVGHAIAWNRALEKAHTVAGHAFNAAARAYARTTGSSVPQPVSFTATALHTKITPSLNSAVHRANAASLIQNYLGGLVMPHLLHALWVIQEKLPARFIDPIILKWALAVSRDFHMVRVEDQRRAERLPGVTDLADLAHNGGWYLDYSTSLIYSPKGKVYVLISKNDLGDKMPPGMKEGIEVLAQLLPESPSQHIMEAQIMGVSTERLYNRSVRRGAQDVVIYGAATMGALTQPDPVAVVHPSMLLDPKYTTGYEMPGFGRGGSVVRGRIAIHGTAARTRFVRSMNYGGHYGGPKPDKPFGVRPTEMDTAIWEDNVLATPRGVALLDDGEALPPWTERQAAEVDAQWGREAASKTFSARRLRHDEGENPDGMDPTPSSDADDSEAPADLLDDATEALDDQGLDPAEAVFGIGVRPAGLARVAVGAL